MTEQTRKYAVSFPRVRIGTRFVPKRSFFNLAKKHIVKGKRGGARNLSQRVDEIAYGI